LFSYPLGVAEPLSQPVVVLMTFPSLEEANRIAVVLVDEHLVACVNLITGVRSVFFWEGAREEADEVLAIGKTTQERFGELAARVKLLHSYSVPEIISLPIFGGSEPYLKWLVDMVSNR
jgi:periplasmic divalent cation tolerance protein